MALGLNVGSTDKLIRLVAGALLLVASFVLLGGLSSTLGIIAIVVGVVLMATGLINFCPLYRILGLSSRKITGQE